jgi:GNAT superfamily N-acetyltransferase
MTLQIVKLDPLKDKTLLNTICKYMFAEWGAHYVNFFDEISCPETLARYYVRHPETQTFIALDSERQLVGWYSFTQRGKLQWMSDVFVVPERRKQGIGALLVKNAQSRYDMIAIQVEEKMIPFYEKYGFKKGRLVVYKGMKGQDFPYYDMLYQNVEEVTSSWTMLIVLLCLIGLGIIAIIVVL